MCSSYFLKPDGIRILNEINDKYSSVFFKNSVDENIRQSSFISRSFKLFQLKRLINDLEKNGDSFNHFDLSNFVFKLDKLAFADAVEPNLSRHDKDILSEARRSILNQGIISYFNLNEAKTGFYRKFMQYFSEAISWKYWRWSFAWMGMPKLIGTSLPPALAHKILLEGLEPHRKEVEKYIPQIKSRSFFNKFSKVYNLTLIISLFTVVPYMVNDYYQDQMRIGTEQARLLLEPLVKSTSDMAKVDQMMQNEIGALEKYIEAYRLKYGADPDQTHIEVVKDRIRKKLNSD